MELRYVVSVDFGQVYDYSTVAVTERRLVPSGESYQHERPRVMGQASAGRVREVRRDVEQHYDLIRLDRVPLRTPYTKVASGIVTLIKELYRKQLEEDPDPASRGSLGYAHPSDADGKPLTVGLAIDEGGVGKAVRDILLKEMIANLEKGRPKVRFLPVTVHGGANTSYSGGFYHVPKRDLISAGLVCYQNERLRVGALRWRDVLEKELANYRLKQNISTGHTAFEPLREGEHDDLLFAVCLGCWAWERALPKVKHLSLENHVLSAIPTPVGPAAFDIQFGHRRTRRVR